MNKDLNIKNKEFLFKVYKEYYFKNIGLLQSPKSIQSREFGIMTFDSKVIRHLSFSTLGKLRAYILQNVPADIYCSNAYYHFPTFPINEKGWIGADIIFDIDLKDLLLPCQQEHTFYICSNCGKTCNFFIEICVQCKSTKIIQNIIPCNICIRSLKKETSNLTEFLKKDFGIEEQNIDILFSGNTGFHIEVHDENFLLLDSKCRSDMVGYLMGKYLSLESLGVKKNNKGYKIKIPLSGYSYGWRKRIIQKLKMYEVSNDKLDKLIKKIGGYDAFKNEIEKIVFEIGCKIDPQVTTDIHRIFRMVGSINSKSGLSKIKCQNLDKFDPLNDASFFPDDTNVNISINTSLKFNFKRKKYSLDKSITTVPLSVAVYLISKKIARMINYSS